VSDPLFLVTELPDVGAYRLDGAEGHHAADVQRLRVGQALTLADGRGGLASAVVAAVARGALDLSVTGREAAAIADPRIVAVQGIAKGDRGELAVQAMTEAGVDEIVPWAAERCVTQWRGERGDRALERWRSTAREAAKQARRAWLPEIAPASSTRGVLDRLRSGRCAGLVLHEQAQARLATVGLPDSGEIVMVIGPEGGISDTELELFAGAGAVAVRLGSPVLRTSTAGVAALAVLSARVGRW
jgi:16S rRNA (uracil1498-N3)-methyltransferase